MENVTDGKHLYIFIGMACKINGLLLGLKFCASFLVFTRIQQLKIPHIFQYFLSENCKCKVATHVIKLEFFVSYVVCVCEIFKHTHTHQLLNESTHDYKDYVAHSVWYVILSQFNTHNKANPLYDLCLAKSILVSCKAFKRAVLTPMTTLTAKRELYEFVPLAMDVWSVAVQTSLANSTINNLFIFSLFLN